MYHDSRLPICVRTLDASDVVVSQSCIDIVNLQYTRALWKVESFSYSLLPSEKLFHDASCTSSPSGCNVQAVVRDKRFIGMGADHK